ncbi:MAG: lamin tail domain-containing protein, partial [Chloroflexota bacterium]|nr:lamin tail domain-containing protein [Chloroflexota bacterium]
SPYTLSGTLAPSQIRVFYRSQTGVALNDTSDEVRLLAPDGAVLDERAYSSATPDQAWNRDAGGLWQDGWSPSPGLPNLPPPTPTPTSTTTPTTIPTFSATATSMPPTTPSPTTTQRTVASATSTPTRSPTATLVGALTFTASPATVFTPTTIPAGLRLNEFLPRPQSDWDGDGTADFYDEYIELVNNSGQAFNLTGLQLDDVAEGTSPFLLSGTLESDEVRAFFRSETGIGLNDSGDSARLLAADGTVLDELTYSSAVYDQTWSRDDAGVWHDDWSPSPGLPNVPPPTDTATATSTATQVYTATPPVTASVTPVPTATHTAAILPYTSTPTPTWGATATVTRTPLGTLPPSPVPGNLQLNEFLPRPTSDWDGDGVIDSHDEYIELVNRSNQTINLTGFQLDDAVGGTSPYTLSGTLSPGGIHVLFRSQTGIALNDDGDSVRLLAPGEIVWDEHDYSSATLDQAWSRDADGAWHDDWAPSPGLANVSPPPYTPTVTTTVSPAGTITATPSITPIPTLTLTFIATAIPTAIGTSTPILSNLQLNEFLPRPGNDWNGDGTADVNDEYIELINKSGQSFDLAGLQLDDAEGGSSAFTLSDTLAPGETRAFFRSETRIALNDTGDEVRLLAPDGIVLDTHAYGSAALDQAWSRDEEGAWHDDWLPSPAGPNQAPATPTPTATPDNLVNLFISEVVYEGIVSGQGDEFVEIWNPTDQSVELAGWRIGDEESEEGNEGMYRFPVGVVVEPDGTIVIARDADAFYERFEQWPDFAFRTTGDPDSIPLLPRDTEWGSGHWALEDSGDEVLLLDGWNRIVDRLAFRNGDFAALGLTGHDISAPAPRAIHHVDVLDSDNVNDWVAYDLPTPGQAYRLPSEMPAAPLGPSLDGLYVASGSLHSHSTYSDGSGPPELAFAVARANGMNFMALTDHSCW